MQAIAHLLSFAPAARFFAPPQGPVVRVAAPLQREIARGTHHEERAPLGRTVTCTTGCVWLTHDGDTRDVVLEAGQSHTCDRPARLVVHALDAARVRIA